jgi:hypothetical protein
VEGGGVSIEIILNIEFVGDLYLCLPELLSKDTLRQDLVYKMMFPKRCTFFATLFYIIKQWRHQFSIYIRGMASAVVYYMECLWGRGGAPCLG